MKVLFALAVALSVPIAAVAARAIDVTGVYRSNWEEVRLVQHGRSVKGSYVCCGGGTIDGEIEGRVLRYRWHEPQGAGEGVGIWKIDGDRLDGTWGRSTVDDGGPWNLQRIQDAQLAR
jgi:hypothetical protein